MDKIEFWKVVTVTDDHECHIDNFGIESNAKDEYERRVELKKKNQYIDHVFMAKVDASTEDEVQYSFRDCNEWFAIRNEMEEAGLIVGEQYWFANGANVYKCIYRGVESANGTILWHIVEADRNGQSVRYTVIIELVHLIKKTYDEALKASKDFLQKRYNEEKE